MKTCFSFSWSRHAYKIRESDRSCASKVTTLKNQKAPNQKVLSLRFSNPMILFEYETPRKIVKGKNKKW